MNELDVRAPSEIVETLGKIGPSAQPAAASLLKLLQASTGYDRTQVIKALGKIGPSRDIVLRPLLNELRDEAKKPRADKFTITSRSLEELRADGIPPDVLAILDGFAEFERDKGLFSSLVSRNIGPENWNRFGSQILKAALVIRQRECDSERTWQAAFTTLQKLGPLTAADLEQIQDLRLLVKNCADISWYLDELAK